jgi:hypothetical protein
MIANVPVQDWLLLVPPSLCVAEGWVLRWVGVRLLVGGGEDPPPSSRAESRLLSSEIAVLSPELAGAQELFPRPALSENSFPHAGTSTWCYKNDDGVAALYSILL